MKLKDQLLAILKSLGLLPDDKVESVTKELDKLDLDKQQAQIVDPSKITDPVLKQMIEGLQNNNTVLGQQIKTLTDTLSAERTEREKAVKIQQDQAKSAHETKVTELVAKALKEGKIVKAKEVWLKQYATDHITEAESWVKEAPVVPGFKAEPEKKNESSQSQDTKSTSMKHYHEHKAEIQADALAAFSTNKN